MVLSLERLSISSLTCIFVLLDKANLLGGGASFEVGRRPQHGDSVGKSVSSRGREWQSSGQSRSGTTQANLWCVLYLLRGCMHVQLVVY